PGVPKEIKNAEIDDRDINRIEAIICSMTPAERRDPSVINGSRRVRIANGSGVTPADVNGLLKQFKTVQQMMKGVGKGKMQKLLIAQGVWAQYEGERGKPADTKLSRRGYNTGKVKPAEKKVAEKQAPASAPPVAEAAAAEEASAEEPAADEAATTETEQG